MQTKMKPVVDPEEVFPKVEKMIYSQAWKFAKTYPITFEEARSEAYIGFLKACYDYNPSKGQKFSSWCYYWVWCSLKDFITMRTRDPHLPVDLTPSDSAERNKTEQMMGEAVELSTEFLQMLEDTIFGASDEAGELLNLLIEPPAELLKGERPTPRQLMTRAKKFLVAKGKNRCKVDNAQVELQKRLKCALA